MSSRPMTPQTVDGKDSISSPSTTPPSSPPSEKMADTDYDPVSESMEREEKKMKALSKTNDVKDRERAQKEWGNANEASYDGQYKKIQFLLDKSKIFANIMQAKLQKQEEKTQARDEAERKRLEKQEEQAEKAAVTSQRKATRAAAAAGDDDASDQKEEATKSRKMPTRTTGGKGAEKGSITKWLKKEDLEAKTEGKSVAEALEEAAEEHNVKPTALGAQNLRSANQPKTVSGGVMRSYQLEGLDWLTSLYENGLNGILADEMGLGKTIQTISFLTFLREKGTNGPFLVAAPLSTLSNWVEEFAKWTPDIPTVLYHGSPAQRAEIRRTRLKNESSEKFPVVCTSYEICMNDQKYLSHFGWKFIIIDEGHRLKNLNCRLIKELKQYRSANRLLITGTPLQNNLAELWSLLNFLMPDVFDTLENFESFFDFSAVLEKDGHKQIIMRERKNNLVASLHAILKPFLLRRVKTDVETSLPKKREYILYAPLTNSQKELYREIREGNSRAYLEQKAVDRIVNEAADSPRSSRSSSLKRKAMDSAATPNKSAKSSRASTPASSIRSGRKANKRQSYKELNDRDYFKQLAESSESESLSETEQEELSRARTIALAKKEIAQKKLQNPIMQLRLACNSPHNFYWPYSEADGVDNTLVTESGKLLLLDRLVPYLLSHKHKTLIFSQFKTQLDILESWASELHEWPTCRIDGAVKQEDRRLQIKEFNDPNSETNIFLLSTRAGGQGINLAAADTVILFDSDWNPQQDLQAQDRAHRIGQTKPVIVYRLSTKGTVEQTLLEKADGKRRLEKLVIQKGKFKSMTTKNKNQNDVDELQRLLEEDDFEGYDPIADGGGAEEILSERDLAILGDRSEAAYVRAEKGEGEGVQGEKFRTVETKRGDGDGMGLLEGMETGKA